MAKKKKNARSSQSKQSQARQLSQMTNRQQKPPRRKLPSLFGALLSALLTIATLASTLTVFWPRISVERDEVLNPKKPFLSPFIVKNDGYGFCYPVNYYVFLKNVAIVGGGGIADLPVHALGKAYLNCVPIKAQPFL